MNASYSAGSPGSLASPASEALPCPTVSLGADYTARLERLSLRIAAGLQRREGAGRASLLGAGEESVGSRPYRPGEDLRQLDWALLARLDRPYIKDSRREASEAWTVALDTSASMAVGPIGKLQAAAEVAGGIVSAGLQLGARVELVTRERRCLVRRRSDLGALLEFLVSLKAEGTAGLASVLQQRRPSRESGRVFLLGDLLDVDRSEAMSWQRPGRELLWVQFLAPLELVPDQSLGGIEGQHVRWLDPEGDGSVSVRLDGDTLAAYEGRLEASIERWRHAASQHGVYHGLFSSNQPFEQAVHAILEP